MAKGPFVEIDLTPEQTERLQNVFWGVMHAEYTGYLLIAQVYPTGRDGRQDRALLQVCALVGEDAMQAWNSLRPFTKGTKPKTKHNAPAA